MIESIPQYISKGVIFHNAFLVNIATTIIKSGPNPAKNIGNAEIPAPALIAKKKPSNGANAQINQETKLGFVCPLIMLNIYEISPIRLETILTKINCAGSIPVLKF